MSPQITAIVGLGNPGQKYKNNRHNIGFSLIETLAKLHNAGSFAQKFCSNINEIYIKTNKIILLQPLTYMNLSGQAVAQLLNFYKLPLNALLVVHDDLDLPAFRLRYKIGGSAGGHNGLKSIDRHCGADYHRLRIGIGRPEKKEQVTNYVLSDFTQAEQNYLEHFLPKLAEAIPKLLTADDLNNFINKLQLNHE